MHRHFAAVPLLGLSLLAVASVSADLLWEYTFNEVGPVVHTTQRSAEDFDLAFETQDGRGADWHGAPGSGVSGRPVDRAFDNSASTLMGSDGLGGRAASVNRNFVPFDSVTLCGWFKTDSGPADRFARLFYWGQECQVYCYWGGVVYFSVGEYHESSPIVTPGDYSDVGTWVFFAVTYDSTKTVENVLWYKGTPTTAVRQVWSADFRRGPVTSGNTRFLIGNNELWSRPTQPFDGLMDNFRVYAGPASSGVLTLSDLESLRASDVAGILPPLRLKTRLELVPPSLPMPAQLTFQWASVPGYRFQLQKTASLKGWTDIAGAGFEGDGHLKQHTVATAGPGPWFFRLKITALP